MPKIEFSSQLARHVECPEELSLDAASLGETFDLLFANHPKLRDYVVTEDGAVRKHITIFVDGTMLSREECMQVPVTTSSEVFVMQAVAGG